MGSQAAGSGIVAWVESPLQLLGALEHAGRRDVGPLTIIPRGGDAQLEHTATHLADRVVNDPALSARIALDRRVMPARLFADGIPWLIGDAYSGQVQARLDRCEPSELILVDDGAITRLLAQQLSTVQPLLRPRPPRLLAALRRDLAMRTTHRLRRLAADGRLAVTTFLPPDDPAVIALRDLGARVESHLFDMTRRWGERATVIPEGARIVLGSARVADGLDDPAAELQRIVHLARGGAVAYLPHRREPHWFLTAVARVRDVVVVAPRLPIELALAGADRPLEVIAATSATGASTATETLPIVLRGTGSIVRLEPSTAGSLS